MSESSSETALLRLIAASERMASSRSIDGIVAILRETAREVIGADGIAVVLRDDDKCFYAAEDAVSPLWTGSRFPADSCISGWAMTNRQTAAISDIRLDPRIPQAAYSPTFVRSLIMAPIGSPEPFAALGAYWAEVRAHDAATVIRLEALARAAAVAIENARLIDSIQESERQRALAMEQLAEFAATLEQRVEERTRQLELAQDALRQARKLEAMGQLTGGVAHDFNNLLTPIMGSLDLLKRRNVGGEREQRLIDGAIHSAERAKTLVQRLLAFARRQPLSPTAVDFTDLLTELQPLIATTVGSQVGLTVTIAEGLPHAMADRTQVEMAILNLALNARDAMPTGGMLTVRADHQPVGTGHAAGLQPGSYIRVTMADTGAGMDEETRLRAIEPFFSTKGTGLGLSMVHGLATQLGGGLAIASQPGAGTAIEIWLPAAGEAPAVSAEAAAASAAPRSGTVLLVDDDDIVRAATADMLAELGFDVLEASSGARALILLEGRPDIDFLVTDHLMPAMTGMELIDAVRAKRPELPILVVSGYSDVAAIAAGLPMLRKPFRQNDLAAMVASIFRPVSAAAE
jgi:signal transduction histidine kinase/CheY-like chemotaxis protein